MSRADDLAAKAARLRATQQAAAQAPAASPAVVEAEPRSKVSTSVPPEVLTSAQVRTRPVRLTVDVPPADHAALARLSLDAASRLGLARVHGQEIVRALIHRMLSDQHLQAEVLADVEKARRAR